MFFNFQVQTYPSATRVGGPRVRSVGLDSPSKYSYKLSYSNSYNIMLYLLQLVQYPCPLLFTTSYGGVPLSRLYHSVFTTASLMIQSWYPTLAIPRGTTLYSQLLTNTDTPRSVLQAGQECYRPSLRRRSDGHGRYITING